MRLDEVQRRWDEACFGRRRRRRRLLLLCLGGAGAAAAAPRLRGRVGVVARATVREAVVARLVAPPPLVHPPRDGVGVVAARDFAPPGTHVLAEEPQGPLLLLLCRLVAREVLHRPVCLGQRDSVLPGGLFRRVVVVCVFWRGRVFWTGGEVDQGLARCGEGWLAEVV